MFILITICLSFFFYSLKFLVIPPLQLLQLFNFLHSFVENLSFLQNFSTFILESFVLFNHTLPSCLQFLVLLLESFCFLPFLSQSALCFVPLSLKLFPLPHNTKILLTFSFYLLLMFFKLLLFTYQFLPFSVQFFTLTLVSRYLLVPKADRFHVSFDHTAQTISLLGIVLFQPSAYHIEQTLHS